MAGGTTLLQLSAMPTAQPDRFHLASNGNAKPGAEVLRTATHLYPNDAGTGSVLGTSLELLNEEAAAATAYRRAITLEEGFTIAHASLGCIASSKGAWQTAIASRRGRGINPISC